MRWWRDAWPLCGGSSRPRAVRSLSSLFSWQPLHGQMDTARQSVQGPPGMPERPRSHSRAQQSWQVAARGVRCRRLRLGGRRRRGGAQGEGS